MDGYGEGGEKYVMRLEHRRLERKKAQELFEKQQQLKAQQQGYNMIIKLGNKNKKNGPAAALSWGSVGMNSAALLTHFCLCRSVQLGLH